MIIRGWVDVRKNGILIASGPNLVTVVGKTQFAKMIEADGITRPSHFALGDDATAPTVLDTALIGTEHFRGTIDSIVRTNNEIKYSASTVTNGTGGTVTVREMGLFDAASAGNMFARFRPIAFTMLDTESINLSWNLIVG